MKSNPFIKRGLVDTHEYTGAAMTIKGARNKTFTLVGFTLISFILSWVFIFSANINPYTLSTIAGIVGFVFAMLSFLKPARAKTFGILYALAEGIFIGSISLVFEAIYPGIVTTALLLTLLAIVFTLLLYNHAPDLAGKIRKGVMIATFAVLAVSLLGLVFSLFGIQFILWSNTPIGIAMSLVVLGIAIANLMIDYDNIVLGAKHGLPAYMEWFFAMGILVTVVWVYMEILSLLSRLASRD